MYHTKCVGMNGELKQYVQVLALLVVHMGYNVM